LQSSIFGAQLRDIVRKEIAAKVRSAVDFISP
jgi:hypothetical protein